MENKRKIVTNILGSYRRAGDEHLYHCPFCNHHKKKMSVNFSINSFKCWVCDTRGKNIYRLVRKFGNYQQRQKYLELQGRLDLSEFDDIFKEINNVESVQTIDLPNEFISLCNKHLPIHSKEPLEYLKSRNISKKEILKWKIGYCKEGRYSGRIIIPSININGDCDYFIARSYVGHGRRYLNPECSRDIVFNALMVDWDEPVVLVEGVFDAIVVGDNAIPILGSTLREDSKLFQALAVHDTPIYMALDKDAEKKSQWIIRSLLKYDLEVKKINIEEYEDVGTMSREAFYEKLKTAEEIDSDMYFLERLLKKL
jgi:transcription elongation factor Elf1